MANGKEESPVGPGWHFSKGPWGEPVFDDFELWEELHSARVNNRSAEETLIPIAAIEEEPAQIQVAEEIVPAA